jgi:hypothetical protein
LAAPQGTIAKLPLVKDIEGCEFDGTPTDRTLTTDLAGEG